MRWELLGVTTDPIALHRLRHVKAHRKSPASSIRMATQRVRYALAHFCGLWTCPESPRRSQPREAVAEAGATGRVHCRHCFDFECLAATPAHPHDAPLTVAVVTGSGHLEGTTREWNVLKSQLNSADAGGCAGTSLATPSAVADGAGGCGDSTQPLTTPIAPRVDVPIRANEVMALAMQRTLRVPCFDALWHWRMSKPR